MTARIWHGKTAVSEFEMYSKFLQEVAIPDYSKTTGFKGLNFLRNIKGNEAHYEVFAIQ